MVYIVFCIVVLVIYGILYSIKVEHRDFNGGICPKCGKRLKHFDTDSQGGRGYCCYDCHYFIWISYGCVDKKNLNKLWKIK